MGDAVEVGLKLGWSRVRAISAGAWDGRLTVDINQLVEWAQYMDVSAYTYSLVSGPQVDFDRLVRHQVVQCGRPNRFLSIKKGTALGPLPRMPVTWLQIQFVVESADPPRGAAYGFVLSVS